jgi:hypothetical protein
LAVLAALGSCGREPASTPLGLPQVAPRSDLAPVVASRIADLERQLEAPPLDDADQELRERVEGLLETLSGADERL